MLRRSVHALVAVLALAGACGGEGGDAATTTSEATTTTAAPATTTTTVAGASSPRTSIVGSAGQDGGDAGEDGRDEEGTRLELALRQLSSATAAVVVTGTVDSGADVAGVWTRCGDTTLDHLSVGGATEGEVDLRFIVHADEVGCGQGVRTIELVMDDGTIVEAGPLPPLDGVTGPLDAGVLSADGVCASLDRRRVDGYLRSLSGPAEVRRLTCSLYTADGRFVLVEAYVDPAPATPLHPVVFGCVDSFTPSVSSPEILICHRSDRAVAVLSLPDVLLAVSSERAVGSEAVTTLLGIVRDSLEQLRG